MTSICSVNFVDTLSINDTAISLMTTKIVCRHVGDLGNVMADADGTVSMVLTDSVVSNIKVMHISTPNIT